MEPVWVAASFVAGVAAGGGLVWGVMQSRLSRERESRIRCEERLREAESVEAKLDELMRGVSSQVLKESIEQLMAFSKQTLSAVVEQAKGEFAEKSKSIEGVVAPVKDALVRLEERIGELEKAREGAYRELLTQVRELSDKSEALRQQTERLYTALRRPSVRGRWGELTLRNAVEVAGLSEYCDFEEQVRIKEGSLRPDMVIRLPGNRRIVVDAKVPIDSYMDALECEDGERRAELLKRHSRALREHLRKLSEKQYWQALGDSVDFVVMFVPSEAVLAAALEADRELLEDGIRKGVIVATPTLLVALLRVVALTWREFELTRQVRELIGLAKELASRSSVLVDRMERLGGAIGKVVKSYNDLVGSWEGRFAPHLRKFAKLGSEDIKELKGLEAVVRGVKKVE